MKPKACIIIPTHNEAESIEKTIHALELMFEDILDYEMSILVFDSASTDRTPTILKQLQNQYSNVSIQSEATKTGLGSAYIQAMSYAMDHLKADILFEFDADGSHQPRFIPKMLEKLEQGYDVVIGSRYIRGGSIAVNWPWYRQFISLAGNWIARLFLSARYKDFTSGFRATKTTALSNIDLNTLLSKQYAYKIHLFWALHRSGAKIAEYPIEFIDRENGYSKFPKNNICESLIVILKLRWRALIRRN